MDKLSGMNTTDPRGATRFIVIGGGLGGALMTVYLGRAGYEVDLYERRPDPEAGQSVGGRSINLAVSTRGIEALAEVGLAEEVLKSAIPMRGRMIHAIDGHLHFQPYDKDPSRCINSIGRGTLNNLTIMAARRYPNVRVHFNHRCIDVEGLTPPQPPLSKGGIGLSPPLTKGGLGGVMESPTAHLLNLETNERVTAAGGIILGLDGAYSTVRGSMQRLDRFEYSQSYLEHGYKELTIPPKGATEFQMERNALHIWPRRSFMMIALPNADGSFTCTLFFPFEGPLSFSSLRSDDNVRRFFDAQFPDAVPLMPTLLEDFQHNPTGSMVTVRCNPWHHQGKVALLGDAAHAVVPFYGQGANAAFEDCAILNECIERFAPDWKAVFQRYQTMRKLNADALADLAIGNFIEMRDKTGSRIFRAYKKFDRTMHRVLPGWYMPLYTMVSFTRNPYASAVRRAKAQNRKLALWGVTFLMYLGCVLLGWLRDEPIRHHLLVSATLLFPLLDILICLKLKERYWKLDKMSFNGEAFRRRYGLKWKSSFRHYSSGLYGRIK